MRELDKIPIPTKKVEKFRQNWTNTCLTYLIKPESNIEFILESRKSTKTKDSSDTSKNRQISLRY